MKQVLLGGFLVLASLLGCTEESDPQGECDCPESVRCTYEFRTITVRVVDASGEPVRLDGVKTIRSSDQEEVNNQAIVSGNYQQGYYRVVSDSNSAEISRCGEEFVFEGYRDKKKVVSGTFVIKFNCCHVEKLSGPEQIVLE